VHVVQLGPYPPPHGGVQSNLVAIERAAQRRGWRTTAINLTRHRDVRAEGVLYPRTAAELLGILARLRCDVLHLHVGGHFSLRLQLLALACTMVPGVRAVLSFHSGGFPTSPAGRAARRRSLLGFVSRRFDRIIAVNDEIRALFLRMGVEQSRVRVIAPHAVDLGALGESGIAAPGGALGDFMRAHRPALVTVGLLEPEYALPLQLALLPRVRERFPDAGLAILGSGSLEAELRERITAMPDRAHVLLCGDVPHDESLRAIATADVLLRTTHYDGDSVAVREALHIGTPVVATDNGMRPAGVRVIPVNDLEALVAAVLETLAADGPRRRAAAGDADVANVEAVLDLYA
jgi:glycosyltransferase involved in cell wall biosynthesis